MSPQPDPVVLGVLFESVPGLEPCYLPFETGLERLAQLTAVLGGTDLALTGRAQSRAATARVALGDSCVDAFHLGSTAVIALRFDGTAWSDSLHRTNDQRTPSGTPPIVARGTAIGPGSLFGEGSTYATPPVPSLLHGAVR